MEREKAVELEARQRIEELFFYLYNRALHPELFRIYQTHKITRHRYQAEVWITGLSHVITLQYGDEFVTELIAPSDESLPKSGLVTSFRFRGERDNDYESPGGVRHIFSSQVERLSANLYEHNYRDLAGHARRRGLFVEFSRPEGSPGPAPFAFIDPEAREWEIHFHSFYAFPEEHAFLKMQSIFEVPRR